MDTGEEAPDQLLANPSNWRVHSHHQEAALEGVLDHVGWVQQVLVNRRTGHLIDGHLRVALAIRREEPTVPVVYVDLDPAEEALILATFDPISQLAGADREKLDALLREVQIDHAAVQQMLADLAQEPDAITGQARAGALSARFGLPPFSVLDARQGYWQERKRAWLALGIESELGRGENALGLSSECEEYREGAGEYRKRPRAAERVAPGGSRRPAAKLGPDGKTRRGDGRGRTVRA